MVCHTLTGCVAHLQEFSPLKYIYKGQGNAYMARFEFKLAISEAKSAISSSTNEITEEDTSSSISVPGTTPTWTIAEASEHTDKQSSYQQNKLLPVQSKQRLAPGLYYKKKRNLQDAGTSESSSSAQKKIVRLYFLAICNHVFQLTTFVLHQKKN
ncbi:uncharacterized protein LOC120652428 [Panicum virgatum]|uniref:uncharacterized protein LOC120652428 n=1 Tax=Panicum virgatum TaxID=38727 RepID=UPI0019D559F7|nr:uncharacterized protein LOC120652428 [Panicum virgatum]